jgi:hypothetical protein
VKPVLILNKADACENTCEKAAKLERVALGAPVFVVSPKTGQGMEECKPLLIPGKTIVMPGCAVQAAAQAGTLDLALESQRRQAARTDPNSACFFDEDHNVCQEPHGYTRRASQFLRMTASIVSLNTTAITGSPSSTTISDGRTTTSRENDCSNTAPLNEPPQPFEFSRKFSCLSAYLISSPAADVLTRRKASPCAI